MWRKRPTRAERAILRAAERLGITEDAAETAFHRLLIDLGGWAQHARWLLWQAELKGGTDATLTDLLAIRLIWEEALSSPMAPQSAARWAETPRRPCRARCRPRRRRWWTPSSRTPPSARTSASSPQLLHGAAPAAGRPALQAAFCIDVRSEVFRRALESLIPRSRRIGFAGFFGLPVAHRPHGTDVLQPHLPVLLKPALTTDGPRRAARPSRRSGSTRATVRAWGRFRQAAVSSFAFVEAAGPAYALKLVKDALGLGQAVARGRARAPRSRAG